MDLDEALYEARRTFSPPRELGSTPRSVRLTGSGWALVAAAVVLIATGIVIGVVLQHEVTAQTAERLTFAEHGVTTDAVVTNLRRTGGDSKRHFVAYRFDTPSGSHAGETRISSSLWRSLQTGAAITVRYLPDDPSRSTIASGAAGGLPVWLPYLAGVMPAAGALLLIWMLMRQRSLLTEGRAAPAVVTDVITRKTGHGTHRSIRYRFPLMSGAIATGKSDTPRKPPSVGTVLCVVYLPDEPRRNAPYPFALVRTGDVT